MEIVIIIVSVIFGLIMLGVSFYLYTMYCHRIRNIIIAQDKGIGSAIGSKLVVVFCQFLGWGQLLLILFGVSGGMDMDGGCAESSDGLSLDLVYYIVYIVIFVFTSFVIPFNIFLYESDEEDSLGKRVLWSGVYAGGFCIIWCAFVFISYIWLSKIAPDYGNSQQKLSIPLYMMTCMSLVGSFFLVINSGVGLVFLPYELIKDYFIRPRKITKEEALEMKTQITIQSDELIKRGEELKKMEGEIKGENYNWFMRKKKNYQLNSKLQEYKKEVGKLEEKFNLFDEQIGGIKPLKSGKGKEDESRKEDDNDFEKKLQKKETSQIFYCLYLVIGIIAALISLFVIIQLLGTAIEKSPGVPQFCFIDCLLETIPNKKLGFLSVIIFALLVLYLQICAIKGNIVYGLKIPFVVSIHPLKKDRTYLNTFLFNINIMMLSSVTITQLAAQIFPRYLSCSRLEYYFYTKIRKLIFFGMVYKNRVVIISILAVFGLSIIVMIFQIVRSVRNRKANKGQ